MEQFQGPGACLNVERIIREGTDDASQEKCRSCLFVLKRYHEGSTTTTLQDIKGAIASLCMNLFEMLLVSVIPFGVLTANCTISFPSFNIACMSSLMPASYFAFRTLGNSYVPL